MAHPLPEVLLLAVCGTIADCDDYDHIAAWGEAHLEFLREILPYHHGVTGGRWLTLLMNRIDPALFSVSATTSRLVLDQEAVTDYLLAVITNYPTLRAEIEDYFSVAPAESLDSVTDLDKGHGRIVDWPRSSRCLHQRMTWFALYS